MDKLAKVYLRIRGAKAELTTQYEAELAELDKQEDEIENAMKTQMMALGTKSMKTDAGTVMLGTKTRYTTQDWGSFKDFVIQNDAVDLLERRIAQRNMAQFLEENPTLVPPGLNSDTEYQISVRKPTK
jgi:multidrug efflux pump subunit AcrB